MATLDAPKPRKRYSDYPPETQRVIDSIILLGLRVARRLEAEGKLDEALREHEANHTDRVRNVSYSQSKGGEKKNGKAGVA